MLDKMNRQNIYEIIDMIPGLILALSFYIIIVLTALILWLPVQIYNKISILARRRDINISKLLASVFSIAFLGGCGYGFYAANFLSSETGGGVVFVNILISMMVLICGAWGWNSITEIKYPNIQKLERRKNIIGLIRALKYDDWSIQESAADALERIGDERANEPLKEYHDAAGYSEQLYYSG